MSESLLHKGHSAFGMAFHGRSTHAGPSGCHQKVQSQARDTLRRLRSTSRTSSTSFLGLGDRPCPWASNPAPSSPSRARRLTNIQALYQHMLEELFLGDMEAVDPETCHYWERFWPAVFSHEEYCCWDESEISEEEFNDHTRNDPSASQGRRLE